MSFFAFLFFALFSFLLGGPRPAKSSELQAVHCIMGDVVDILHGCWTQNIHTCLCGFGTDRPLLGRALSFALCCRSGTL